MDRSVSDPFGNSAMQRRISALDLSRFGAAPCNTTSAAKTATSAVWWHCRRSRVVSFTKGTLAGGLADYGGPGDCGRRDDTIRNARLIGNRIQYAPMLFWLAEVLGVPDDDQDRAFAAVLAAPPRDASR
jgi:hypothetical protein